MPGCTVQSYGKVPAVANVRDATVLLTTFTSAGAPVIRLKITLCGSPEMLKRTVPPTGMVVLNGLNTLPGVKTSAVVFPGGVTGGVPESDPQPAARESA